MNKVRFTPKNQYFSFIKVQAIIENVKQTFTFKKEAWFLNHLSLFSSADSYTNSPIPLLFVWTACQQEKNRAPPDYRSQTRLKRNQHLSAHIRMIYIEKLKNKHNFKLWSRKSLCCSTGKNNISWEVVYPVNLKI